MVVITGKDKAKQSKILEVRPKAGTAIVEGVNIVKRRQKPRKQGQKGSTISVPSPIKLSNLQPYCSKCKKGVRVSSQGKGKDKIRICAKCKSKI